MDDNVTHVEEIVVQFYDETFNITKAYYDVKITVKTRLYDSGVEYYDITYNYKFHPMELKNEDDIFYFQKVIHPFYQEDQQGKYGEIIRKNKMTTCLVEYLLKSDEALMEDIGLSTPQRYRSDIIHSIARLWD
jgi:hypothetical protein